MLHGLKNFPFPLSEVETNITKRWEMGIPHRPESKEIAKAIFELDFAFGGDYFDWKYGGDGDNGEHLLYLLDIYFETKEKAFEINGIKSTS